METALVAIEDGKLIARWSNSAEAKLALKELKLLKKEQQLAKRAIMEQMRTIRAKYTNDVRERGSKFIGGGSTGRIVRAFQTKLRAGHRINLAREIAPLELRRSNIEGYILRIDLALSQVEAKIINYSIK